MKAETEKKLNLANTILGVGTLLLIVPLGFTMVTFLTMTEDTSAWETMISLGWIFVVSFLMIPLGAGMFIGGLTWMLVTRQRAKKEELDEDSMEEIEENM